MNIKSLFENLKNRVYGTGKKKIVEEMSNCKKAIKDAKDLGQTQLSEQLQDRLKNDAKILELIDNGYNRFFLKEDILDLIQRLRKTEAKKLTLIELEKYKRVIPAEEKEKILSAKKYFDDIYILYTDQSQEKEEQLKEKDPIAFGIIKNDKNIMDNRMFYICDWVDEYCDLTLDKLLALYQGFDNENHMHRLTDE